MSGHHWGGIGAEHDVRTRSKNCIQSDLCQFSPTSPFDLAASTMISTMTVIFFLDGWASRAEGIGTACVEGKYKAGLSRLEQGMNNQARPS